MRLKITLLIVIIFMLAGCGEINPDSLKITLNPGLDTIELGTEHVDFGAEASYGLRKLHVITISNTVNIEKVGTYEIVYQATYGTITKHIRRMVTVIDETAPVVTLNPGVDTIILGATWIDAGVTIFDQSEIRSVTITGVVGHDIGDYAITYEVTDIHGNLSTVTRMVSVVEIPMLSQ